MKAPRPAAPLGRETCRAAFAIQQTDDAAGTFRGMASVFGTVIDTWIPTVIHPGAFARTLNDAAAVKRVKVLYQHCEFEPIGKPLQMVETSDGLDVQGKISETVRGKDTLILLRDGVITELSIGFDPVRWEMEDEGNGSIVRHLYDLNLYEFSPVTFAANRDALVYSVNSLGSSLALPPDLLEALRPAFQKAGSATDATEVLFALIAALREQHVGKVLSSKNQQLVSEAVTALQALLSAANPQDDSEEEALDVPDEVNLQLRRELRELDLAALSLSLS